MKQREKDRQVKILGCITSLCFLFSSFISADTVSDISYIENIRVVQVPGRDIHAYCNAGRACVDYKSRTIYTIRIESINDYVALQALGEEVAHVMGYRHE